MSKNSSLVRSLVSITCILSGFSVFLHWLGFDPRILVMSQPSPHNWWLLLSLSLLLIGIGLSIWTCVVQITKIKLMKGLWQLYEHKFIERDEYYQREILEAEAFLQSALSKVKDDLRQCEKDKKNALLKTDDVEARYKKIVYDLLRQIASLIQVLDAMRMNSSKRSKR